jgi:hypothetical protein
MSMTLSLSLSSVFVIAVYFLYDRVESWFQRRNITLQPALVALAFGFGLLAALAISFHVGC